MIHAVWPQFFKIIRAYSMGYNIVDLVKPKSIYKWDECAHCSLQCSVNAGMFIHIVIQLTLILMNCLLFISITKKAEITKYKSTVYFSCLANFFPLNFEDMFLSTYTFRIAMSPSWTNILSVSTLFVYLIIFLSWNLLCLLSI